MHILIDLVDTVINLIDMVTDGVNTMADFLCAYGSGNLNRFSH